MKKLISIIISTFLILNLSASIYNVKALELLYTGPSPGFFVSKTIPELEKTMIDFFTKYPDRNAIKDEHIKSEYDTLMCMKSDNLPIPKKFKEDMDCLTGISPGNQKSVVLYFKKDDLNFCYVISYEITPDTEWYSVKNLAKKSDKTKVVGGIPIYSYKYKEGAPMEYFWGSDGRYRALDVRGDSVLADCDYFDYCDMYEYKLNLEPKDISAGEGAYQNSIPLKL
ncbi:MAG TPA: hypothetical protein PKI60_04510 [Oscillospiraceae bacterium]|nr:hypothetical protein [Oscillospiraceae bacterium]